MLSRVHRIIGSEKTKHYFKPNAILQSQIKTENATTDNEMLTSTSPTSPSRCSILPLVPTRRASFQPTTRRSYESRKRTAFDTAIAFTRQTQTMP